MRAVREWLGSALFTTYLFVSVVPYSLMVLVVSPFGHRACYAVARHWVDTVLWLCRRLCGIDYRVEGLENVPERNTVVLLKHSSAYETIVEVQLFPPQTWVLKRELMWAPFLGWGLALLKPIAINRNARRSAVEQVVRQGTERLADGLWVMIFPEGTRVGAGQSRRYGLSGALLAAANDLPVLPVAHDAGDYWPRRGLRKRPGTVRFVIGPPIEAAGRDAREVTAEARAWIDATVERLRRESGAAPP